MATAPLMLGVGGADNTVHEPVAVEYAANVVRTENWSTGIAARTYIRPSLPVVADITCPTSGGTTPRDVHAFDEGVYARISGRYASFCSGSAPPKTYSRPSGP